MTADLHLHTNASDGSFTPGELIFHAKNANVGVLAVTDHDTVHNSAEVALLCRAAGIIPVNGIEISAYEGALKVHTLGYGFDPQNAVFRNFCKKLYNNSLARAQDVIAKLHALGVDVPFEEVLARRSSPEIPVHSMHIAAVGAEVAKMRDRYEFYRKYMMPGCPAYSDLLRPSPEEAVSVINAAGGIASVAHPGRIELPTEATLGLIERLAEAGLGGIEVYYPAHTNVQTVTFLNAAEKLGLYVTGGSDTHFYGGSHKIGSPCFRPSAELLRRLNI